jgi:hypothetical protein
MLLHLFAKEIYRDDIIISPPGLIGCIFETAPSRNHLRSKPSGLGAGAFGMAANPQSFHCPGVVKFNAD